MATDDPISDFELGFRFGFNDGYEVGYARANLEIEQEWAALASKIKAMADRPTHEEIGRRRSGANTRATDGQSDIPRAD